MNGRARPRAAGSELWLVALAWLLPACVAQPEVVVGRAGTEGDTPSANVRDADTPTTEDAGIWMESDDDGERDDDERDHGSNTGDDGTVEDDFDEPGVDLDDDEPEDGGADFDGLESGE